MQELRSEDLYQYCDYQQFSFESTAELEPMGQLGSALGQPRAVESLRFGTKIPHSGYNIFVFGPPGTGRHYTSREILTQHTKAKDTPMDYCYVNNFQESTKPKLLKLPPGQGNGFSKEMDNLIEEVRNSIKAAFESEEYQNRVQALEQEFKEQHQNAFEELNQKANEKNLQVARTPNGITFAPIKEGEVISPEEFQKLPEEEKKEIEEKIKELQSEAQKIFQKMPVWQKEVREKLKDLNREIASYAIAPLIIEVRKKYEQLQEVDSYLQEVEKDILENVPQILGQEGEQAKAMQQSGGASMSSAGEGVQSGAYSSDESVMRKYRVNVLVDHGQQEGAPVIYENNPTYANLVGRVEHMSRMGALITDFNLIKPGALHRANGGALILDAHKVLLQPGSWDGLKRTLKSAEIKIESLAEMFSLISTVSLEPEPVPLDVKVVLIGSPLIYYLLQQLDPEFEELFKVAADFDIQMDWNQENQELFARLIGDVVRKNELHHFNKEAIARLIEHTARMVGDSEKMTTRVGKVTELIQEADFWANEENKDRVTAEDVQKAIDSWTYRSDRIRERIQEEIRRGTLLIDTQGSTVGQVNGLSVLQLGDFMFGRPNRITARVRLGSGEVVDIEREAKLSGPIHSKGVLILSGFIGSRYALDIPLSLNASLVFEQSYSGIEGDSASSAELYALISSISGIPLKQSLAVTGSVNQNGDVQAIGGVNEKIEGFFDICEQRGLSGEQGVIIPESNVKHLMLKKEVIQAVEDGNFHIYPVQNIDQGLELLTGKVAGQPDENNLYPEDSVNGIVQNKLNQYAEKRKQFASEISKGGQLESKE